MREKVREAVAEVPAQVCIGFCTIDGEQQARIRRLQRFRSQCRTGQLPGVH